MPFTLRFDEEAAATIKELKNGDANATAKLEKVNRALGNLQRNPRHPGLNSYEYQNFKGGPSGVKIWHSYVENNTPGAWRIFWRYGPDETTKGSKGKDVRVPVITILRISRTPKYFDCLAVGSRAGQHRRHRLSSRVGGAMS